MVSTRRGDYSTPEKNPPRPLECSPASRRPGDEEDKAEEDEAMSAAVDYATSLTFYYENDVAAGGNYDAGGNDRGMNVDDGGDDRGMNDNEGEQQQQVEEEMGEAWERVTRGVGKSEEGKD